MRLAQLPCSILESSFHFFSFFSYNTKGCFHLWPCHRRMRFFYSRRVRGPSSALDLPGHHVVHDLRLHHRHRGKRQERERHSGESFTKRFFITHPTPWVFLKLYFSRLLAFLTAACFPSSPSASSSASTTRSSWGRHHKHGKET